METHKHTLCAPWGLQRIGGGVSLCFLLWELWDKVGSIWCDIVFEGNVHSDVA